MEIARAVNFMWFEFMTFSLQGFVPIFKAIQCIQNVITMGKITRLEKQECQKQPFGIHLQQNPGPPATQVDFAPNKNSLWILQSKGLYPARGFQTSRVRE
jgi:hypothetical protein